MNPLAASFALAFEISPIILTGGAANNLPGASLPIIAYTEGQVFSTILSGGGPESIDDFFAHFTPMPGTSLIENEIGEYPFANQTVAANAIIAKPLSIILMMVCPATSRIPFSQRAAIMQGLQALLAAHNNGGGTYTILTPSQIFTDCIMTRMVDITSGETKQRQIEWQLEFRKPLVSLQDAQNAQNSLMSKLSAFTPVSPDASGGIPWSGTPSSVANPAAGVMPSVLPSGSGLPPSAAVNPLPGPTAVPSLSGGVGSTTVS